MDFLQHLLDTSSFPALSAFLLGILTTISPCPLATNITAIGFISKDLENRRRIFWRGMAYALGRIIAYAGLALLLIPLLQKGASAYAIQNTVSTYGEMIIAPLLLLIGGLMLFGKKLRLPSFGFSGQGSQQLKKRGGWGALLLGILFALAFCPSSGLFYFGMLIPLAAAETEAYLLPVIFALATALPVMIVAWILAYSVARLGKFYNKLQKIQKIMNLAIGGLFVLIGLYYAWIFWS